MTVTSVIPPLEPSENSSRKQVLSLHSWPWVLNPGRDNEGVESLGTLCCETVSFPFTGALMVRADPAGQMLAEGVSSLFPETKHFKAIKPN